MSQRIVPAIAIAASLFLSQAGATARAQSINLADRIEEDWVLVVDASASGDGPQVNTIMSPTANLYPAAASLGINYQQSPNFTSGGLQALLFNQYGLASATTLGTNPLTANETVSWTQRMSLSDANVKFSVPALTSTAWGTINSDAALVSFPLSISSFPDYSPDTSVSSSGGAWKTKGVTSLTLVQVRYYVGGTLIKTDNTSRPVDCTKSFTKP
jgi:hypothetical protein